MKFIFSLLVIGISQIAFTQSDLYHKAYGNPEGQQVLFMHDGPGGNSAEFEGMIAPELANSNFYVIVYDRRGEGRSADPSATHSSDEFFGDLKNLHEIYHFKNLTIVAEGYGAILAADFVQMFPDWTKRNILINPPQNLVESSIKTLSNVEARASKNSDDQLLKKVSIMNGADKNSLEKLAFCYEQSLYVSTHPEGKLIGDFTFSQDPKRSKHLKDFDLKTLQPWVDKAHFDILESPKIEAEKLLSQTYMYKYWSTPTQTIVALSPICYEEKTEIESAINTFSKSKVIFFEKNAQRPITFEKNKIISLIENNEM